MCRNENFSLTNLPDERAVVEQPWLAKQLAGLAEAPGPVAERADLLLLLARLSLKKQAVALSRCAGRDELVQVLLDRSEYGALLNLLQSDLARWLPDTGAFADLKWLLETLLAVKKQAAGKKARVVWHTPAGPQVRESAAMLEALLEETLAAAAGAWVRCLGGPGGDHRIWEMPRVLADFELAEAVFVELTREPRALALLLEDVPRELGDTVLGPEELLELLQRGAKAAEFCHKTIVEGIEKVKALV